MSGEGWRGFIRLMSKQTVWEMSTKYCILPQRFKNVLLVAYPVSSFVLLPFLRFIKVCCMMCVNIKKHNIPINDLNSLRICTSWVLSHDDIVHRCQKCNRKLPRLKSEERADISAGCRTIIRLYVSLWENNSTSHLIYYLSKQISNEFMVSISKSSKSSSYSLMFIL